jgi:hypothetical protein
VLESRIPYFVAYPAYPGATFWLTDYLIGETLARAYEINADAALARTQAAAAGWTNLLRDLANYGSNLIPRAYSSSGRTLGNLETDADL